MVAAVLLPLTGKYGGLVAIPSVLILMREIAVSALREWMASRNVRDVVQVGFLGKLKTSATMVALSLFLLLDCWKAPFGDLFQLSLAILWFCSIITVWSGALYLFAAWPYLLGSASTE